MAGRAVVAVVRYEDKVLMGKKRTDSTKYLAGEWHLLGETVNEGETDSEALERGVYEESGLCVTIRGHIGKDRSPTGKDVAYYECSANSSELRVGSDLEKAMWVDCKKVLEKCGEKIEALMSKEIRDYFLNLS